MGVEMYRFVQANAEDLSIYLRTANFRLVQTTMFPA